MRFRLTIAAAVLQLLVLAWMAGEREWVVRTGKRIHLRTAPIDPRDVMRGDYVRLDYEISHVPPPLLRDRLTNAPISNKTLPKDTRVYGALQLAEDGVAYLLSLSDRAPKDGLFIRGRLQNASNPELSVRYGVEAYFMEQGKALELEQQRSRAAVQVPLETEVALGRSGLAVLKSVRWSPLGIGVIPEFATATNRAQARQLLAARILLFNATTNREIAIVDLPENGSFPLVPDTRMGNNTWQWARAGAMPSSRPQAADIVLLRPGQTHTNRIDFSHPAWFVQNQKPGAVSKPVPLSEAGPEWYVRFRFIYQPPPGDACTGLPHADRIWHGRLQTRAFGPAGGVD